MIAKVTKFAGLFALVAAGTAALVELPVASRASAAIAAPVVEARLPEAMPLGPQAPAERRAPKPADACADQVWPYIGPDCASRDDGRPVRKVRVITSDPSSSVTHAAVAAPAPAAVAPAPQGPAAKIATKPATKPAKPAAAARVAAAAR